MPLTDSYLKFVKNQNILLLPLTYINLQSLLGPIHIFVKIYELLSKGESEAEYMMNWCPFMAIVQELHFCDMTDL